MSDNMIDERRMLDLAARIGVQAKFEGIAKAQFEGILASLDSIEDPSASLLVTAAFAHRQASRLRGRETAKLINASLAELHRAGGRKEDARRLLGLAKWVYEAVEPIRLPLRREEIRTLTFAKLLEYLRRS